MVFSSDISNSPSFLPEHALTRSSSMHSFEPLLTPCLPHPTAFQPASHSHRDPWTSGSCLLLGLDARPVPGGLRTCYIGTTEVSKDPHSRSRSLPCGGLSRAGTSLSEGPGGPKLPQLPGSSHPPRLKDLDKPWNQISGRRRLQGTRKHRDGPAGAGAG